MKKKLIFLIKKSIALYFRQIEKKEFKGKIEKNKVNLIWWDSCVNLGDYLSLVIYDWMCGKRGIEKGKTIGKTIRLLGVGSVLQWIASDATVWGSGILSAKEITTFFLRSWKRRLDIRAVRGPLTRMIVKSAGYDCPEVYGDPAILMPLIYSGKKSNKEYKISLVTHFAKTEKGTCPEIHRINIETHDYKHFIDELLCSEKVISSSLHGIILAEVYGIPAVYLNKDTGDDLKFWDWYMSTGRSNVRYARTVEEAITAEPMEPIDATRLENMQKKLIEVFPVDLWD